MASRRSDLIETALPALFVAAVAAGLWIQHIAADHASEQWTKHDVEESRFAERYGPGHDSQGIEEWLIRDFFQDMRNGVFLDVGASHYRTGSNTYFLETQLGWHGVAVEPQIEFEDGWRLHRPATRFRPFFVSDVSDQQAKLYVNSGTSAVSSASKEFSERWSGQVRERTVPTITLDDLLSREGLTSIDFVSMDIELSEPKALAGFDIERFRPALVCIEAHEQVRQELLNYFARHQYVVVGKYLRADEENLYFSSPTKR